MASSGNIRGLREARAAFAALPHVARTRLNVATAQTIEMIKGRAQAQILASPSVRTRALFNHIAAKMNPKTGRGRVGVTAGTVSVSLSAEGKLAIRFRRAGGVITANPSRYAHFVEFGTRKMAAEPFMVPAAQNETQPYLERCRAAGPLLEKDVAAAAVAP